MFQLALVFSSPVVIPRDFFCTQSRNRLSIAIDHAAVYNNGEFAPERLPRYPRVSQG